VTGTSDAARSAIVEALARLAAATDARDWATVSAIFAADATGYGARGTGAIVARMRAHLDGCGPTQHLLGNHRVTTSGDTGHSLTYARVYHQGADAMAGSFFECMGEYDDFWVRDPGDGWRLTRRQFDMRIMLGDFGVLRPAAAGSGQKGPTP
jgi:hypothetical protein